jgi:hypothetical protein
MYEQSEELFVTHEQDGDGTLTDVPTNLVIFWAFNYTQSHNNGDRIDITVNSTKIVQGSNLTFTIKPILIPQQAQDIENPNIFIIDPSGVLEGAYPPGDMISATGPSNGYIGLTGNQNTTAFSDGTLAFTFKIPNDNLAQGIWTVFVFGNDLKANTTSITVTSHPAPVGFIPHYVGILAAPFGIATSTYGYLMLLTRVPKTLRSGHLARLYDYLPLIALGVGFVLLAYYVIAIAH